MRIVKWFEVKEMIKQIYLSHNKYNHSGSEEVLQIPQNFKAGVSPSDGLVSYSEHSLVGDSVLLIYRCAVSVVYDSSRQSHQA